MPGKVSLTRKFNQEEKDYFAAIRLCASQKQPYVTAAMFRMAPVAAIGLKTFAVDKYWRLYVDPATFRGKNAWDIDECAAVLLHEVNHLIRDHSGRMERHGAHAGVASNYATDAEINDGLIRSGLPLPGGVITPKKLGYEDDQTAEYYYDLMKEKHDKECPTCNGKSKSDKKDPNKANQPGQGNPPGPKGPQGQGAPDPNATGQGQPGQGAGSGPGQPGQGTGSGPGGQGAPDPNATGQGQPGQGAVSGPPDPSAQGQGQGVGENDGTGWMDEPNAGGFCPHEDTGQAGCGTGAGGGAGGYELDSQDKEFPGIGKAEGDLIRRKVAEDVIAHSTTGRGTMPGDLIRWAEGQIAPAQVPWRHLLAAAIKSSMAMTLGKVDYTYRRPSRRQQPNTFIIPSLQRPVPNIAVVVDTSGSMSDSALDTAMAEVNGLLRGSGVASGSITLLSVDADVHISKRITNIKQAKLKGGGGTDMRVGITAAEELSPRPDTIIVLSDGYTPWPDTPGQARLIIVLINDQPGHAQESYGTPSFAKVIEITTSQLMKDSRGVGH